MYIHIYIKEIISGSTVNRDIIFLDFQYQLIHSKTFSTAVTIHGRLSRRNQHMCIYIYVHSEIGLFIHSKQASKCNPLALIHRVYIHINMDIREYFRVYICISYLLECAPSAHGCC